MFKKIVDVINNFNNRVLCIGSLNEESLVALKNNQNIICCDLLNVNTSFGFKGKKGKSKTINMKDLKKHYKKKNLDYIIFNSIELKKYIPRFISTSIYTCCGKVYIMGSNDIYEIERIIKKYKRYKCSYSILYNKEKYLIEIDVSNSKNKFLFDKLYYIFDTLGLISDKISDLIMN